MHSGRFSTRRTPVRVAAAALAAGTLCFSLIVAGSAGAVSNHKTKRLVLSTIQTSTYGTILFSGKTVYTLKASNVACTAKCQRIWPLLLLPKGVTKATAGRGAERGQDRHRHAEGRSSSGDLLGKAALLVRIRQCSGSGEWEHHGHVGQVVGRGHDDSCRSIPCDGPDVASERHDDIDATLVFDTQHHEHVAELEHAGYVAASLDAADHTADVTADHTADATTDHDTANHDAHDVAANDNDDVSGWGRRRLLTQTSSISCS